MQCKVGDQKQVGARFSVLCACACVLMSVKREREQWEIILTFISRLVTLDSIFNQCFQSYTEYWTLLLNVKPRKMQVFSFSTE